MALAMLACKAETAPKLVLLLLLVVLVVCGLLTLVSNVELQCWPYQWPYNPLDITSTLCLAHSSSEHRLSVKFNTPCPEVLHTGHTALLRNLTIQMVIAAACVHLCHLLSDMQDAERLELLLTWMEEEPVMGSIFFLESVLTEMLLQACSGSPEMVSCSTPGLDVRALCSA